MASKDNLIGQQFGKLKVIEKVANTQFSSSRPSGRSTYLCHCSCGIMNVIVIARSLKNGDIRSCGCDDKHTLYHPRISSARTIWKMTYKDGMSFEDFYDLSQMNCFYCGDKPNNLANPFKYRKSNVSQYSIDNGDFIYNGLDRIDQNLLHTKENCLPCCWPCNDCKGTFSRNAFIEWIERVYYNCFIERAQEDNQLQEKVAQMLAEKSIYKGAKFHPRIASARTVWRCYGKEFAFEEFLELTQMKCYYCAQAPYRVRNYFQYRKTEVSQYAKDNGDFIFNGLDRLDNNGTHSRNNVVTCCWECNDRKSDSSKEEFLNWIRKVYLHLEQQKRTEAEATVLLS